jgi:hypothetical protein
MQHELNEKSVLYGLQNYLIQTGLNDMCYDLNAFLNCYTVFHSDRASVGHVVPEYSLPSAPEFVPVNAGTIQNLVLNVYGLKCPLLAVLNCSLETITFGFDNQGEIVAKYFHFLENNLHTHKPRVIMVEDFNTRGEFLNLPNPSGRTRPWGLLSFKQK